jgi:hypothetical protein
MLVKETRQLFKNTYQYKIVLVSAGAPLLRNGNDLDETLKTLDSYDLVNNKTFIRFKSKDALDYCKSLVKCIKNLKDYEIRIESPLISFYTNNKTDIDRLAKLDKNMVKYISVPPKDGIVSGTVIMPKVNYEFKVTMGKTRQEHTDFISWAEKDSRVKLTKSCRRDLAKLISWGGTHFYINGEKNLLVARMMLGGSISKVEKIVKQ